MAVSSAVKSQTFGSKAGRTVGMIVLGLIALFFLAPLLWLCYAAFMKKLYIFQVPPLFVQNFSTALHNFTLDSFKLAFGEQFVAGRAFVNSAFVTVSAVLLTLVISSLAAFAFSFLKFRGRNFLFIMILATMMLPGATMITSLYLVMGYYGLRNIYGLILLYTGSAFSVFLLRQYFVRLPMALIEAAVIDGASKLRIWWQIIIPLSKPALIALAIYQFRAVWNDFLPPMLILKTEQSFTFPILLAYMNTMNINVPWDGIMAIGFIAVLIPVILFIIYQRQFMEGVSGGLKG